DGRIISANAAAVEFYGYTREELLAKTIYDLRQNNDVALAAHQLSQAFASGILFETVHVHKDGHTIPVEVSSHGTNFEGEGFLVSSIRDITARKNAESKLLQLEQSMAAAANGIFLVKPNGKIFWVNAAFTRMTGYSAEEATGKNPRFLKSGQHDTGFYRELWQTILAGKVWQAEIFNRRKDGTIYPENKTITPVIGADGKLSHFICVQEDITERKQAEKAMVISENKFRTLYEQAPVGIFQSSLEGRLLAANPTMARIFGYANPAAMLADGENVAVRFYADPKMRPAVIAQLMTSESGLSTDQEIQLRKRDGTIMVGRIQMRLARTAGTPDYIEGFIEDISTRVAAELELQTSEERYRQLVSNARDLIFILASNGTFISVNPVVEQVSGLGVDHWIGKPFNPLVHPDDLPLAWDNFHRVMKGEVVPPYELRGHPDLPHQVEMEITLFYRTNASGEIVGVMGIGRDITLRKQAEAQMRLMKSALAAAANGIFLADIDGKIFWINDAFTRLTGYSEAEALGQTPKLLNSKQHSPEFFQRIWTHILAGHYWQGEVKNRRKDGTLYDEYQTVTPVKDASGKVTHFICVQEDITNRKQMEMANAQLAAIVTFSDDAIIGKQLDGTITTWNQGAEKIFGFTAAEMVGTSIRRIIPAERQTDEDQILAAIAQGEAIEHFETIRQTKDGRLIDVSITASPIKDAAGKITGVSKVARDITER
ncbi:MAG: PAS domain S-box protein, partial [Verrucomicrobiae bacterium]